MNKEYTNFSEEEVIAMMNETSQLAANFNINKLSSSAVAIQSSNSLTNNVEFWKWMSRNYDKSGIFNTSQSMQQYISQGIGKEEWVIKQLQGKGYEWDWMTQQRGNIKNIFNRYDAGDVVNRAASDVTKNNFLTGNSSEYQMKAYTSNANPDLANTPKDMTVVTNAEKVEVVKSNGYNQVQEFQDSGQIKKATNERFEQAKNGKAYPSYNMKNIAGTMAKAGAIGCVIGMGTEAIASYKLWKQGQLTDKQYLSEVLKSGGNAGVVAGATAGVMIPISATVTAMGMSTLITIPVAFAVGGVIDKIVAPCFGRGKYKELLNSAKYYKDIEGVYGDLINSIENSANLYSDFVMKIHNQNLIHENLKRKSMEVNKELKSLYDSI